MKVLFKVLSKIAPFLLLGLVLVGVDAYRTRHMANRPVELAPVTTLTGAVPDPLELSHSRPVLLYFWATWCGPCKVTSPSVQWLAEHHEVITIALDSGSDAEVAAYLRDAGFNFPVVNDRQRHLAKAFGVEVTPTVVILKNGRVSSATVGLSTPLGLWLRLILA